jgi:hypothetical protein
MSYKFPVQMYDTYNDVYNVMFGMPDHYLSELLNIATEYVIHPVSVQNTCVDVIVTPTSHIDETSLCSRENGPAVPAILGAPFLQPAYTVSPYLGMNATYVGNPALPIYNLVNALMNNSTPEDVEYDYYMWMAANAPNGVSSAVFPHRILFPYTITFDEGPYEPDGQAPPDPTLVGGKLSTVTRLVTMHAPGRYIGHPMKFMKHPFKVPKTVTVLPRTAGPVISRFTPRYNAGAEIMAYPSNADYLVPGAVTENTQFGAASLTSSEYNLNLIAGTTIIKDKLSFCDPFKYIKYQSNNMIDPIVFK